MQKKAVAALMLGGFLLMSVSCGGGGGSPAGGSGSSAAGGGATGGTTGGGTAGGGTGGGTTGGATGGGTGGGATTTFTLQSTAFSNNGNIPRAHTCDGQDVSPPLSWSGAPQGTQSFVIIMEDPDAQQVGGRVWTHWVIYDIPANRTSLQEGFPKQSNVDNIKQGPTDFSSSSIGYYGPCPPPGRTHTYVFTIYALNVQTLGLNPGATKQQVLNAMQNRVLGEATLRGRYGR
ncbi:MAG: YbhB/YbcL family Raf kinase inhibitor-like protein [Aquificaceae bacterium]|nr:YbhB/YbcL family Raf kinase inhibitor-like protein [Aquificaceae bacterium]